MYKLTALLLLQLVVINSVQIPEVTFNNGEKVPIVGLGTFKSDRNQVGHAVKDAIDIGYRHFDCAYIYENEKEIGQAIAEKIAGGRVKREDLFITSKLWNTFHEPEKVEAAFNATLNDLGLQYLDLYLLHWPMGFSENGFSDADYVDTWLAIEKLYKKGLTKSIGISNFNKKQIERLLEHATVIPVTNQVECHPYLNQQKLIDFCKTKKITVTAYSPLGASEPPTSKPNLPKLLKNPTITEIATRLHKTPAQILLRYQTQRGVIVIPKSATKSRIAENFNLFDFELTDPDMAAINRLDVHGRNTLFSSAESHKYYPFKDEY